MAKQVKIDIIAKDKTKQAIDRSKRGLGGLKTAALAVSAALATIGAGRAIKGLVNTGKEIESLQIRFKLLFGSAEEGARAFDTLTEFASRVPFSLEDIAAASGNLAVVAKDAKQLNEILEITGNVAGATGLDFQTTASQIQRAFAGGIASADIFREKGVRDMLGFSAGAKVSVEETQEAFARVFAGDGEFAKTTEELAETLEGTLSMINDKFFNFQLAINKSFFEELKSQFGDLNEFLENNEQQIQSIGEDIGEGLAQALIKLSGAIEFTVENVKELELALGVLLIATRGIIKVIGGLALVYDSVTGKQKELLDMTNSYNEKLHEQKTGMANINAVHNAYLENQEKILEFNDRQIGSIASMSQAYEDLNEKIISNIGFEEQRMRSMQRAFEADTERENERKKQVQDATENFKDAKFKEIDFQKMTQKEAQAMTRAGFRQALQEGAKHNKALFRINQAMNIAEAVMNTATGVTSALKLGPIIGPPLAMAIGAMGAVQVATIAAQQPPAMFGGARQQGSPFLVGERGPELFTPASAGTVTPNNQLPSMGTNNINFTINAVDVSGIEELLNDNRATIVNLINSALNDQGKEALI